MKKFENPIYVTRPLLPSKDVINSRIEKIIDSKWLTNNGAFHQRLENELKEFLDVDNITLFSNGTLALLLGLRSLDLTGEVITTPFTFPATLEALDWNGLTPVFCDIEPETFNIDAQKIEALITEKTTAILAVHVFGNPCDVETIQEIANRYNLKVIYDGAHAFNTRFKGRPITAYGDMTMLSFHATKLFNTIEGGALICKNSSLKKQLDLLKNFGIAEEGKVVLSGLNAKLNEVQAAFGLEVLKCVKEEQVRRQTIKKMYEQCLNNIPGVRVITNLEGEQSSYQYFVIEINEEKYGKSRDFIYEEFKKYNVFTRKYFDPLCSDFEWYKDNKSTRKENLPVAHTIIQRVLSLPYYGELALEEVKVICDLFLHFKK